MQLPGDFALDKATDRERTTLSSIFDIIHSVTRHSLSNRADIVSHGTTWHHFHAG
jgi:hypothetical protein